VFWFGKKQKKYLGVDIGASSIKMVELKKKDERYRLENYSVVYLGKFAKMKPQEDSELLEKRANLIKKAIEKAGINSKKAGFAVSVYSSFSTLVNFPEEMPKEEIAESVKYEAKKYVPVSISDVALDWSIIPPLKKGNPQQVLLIAVPKDVINNYQQIAKISGLKINSIEEESFPLVRSLVGNDKTPLVLVDWGARSVGVTIIDRGYIRGIHNLEKGGFAITRSISRKAQLDLEQAEKKKLSLSGDRRNNSVEGIIEDQLKNIFYEIKKIVDSYQNENNKEVEKCILSGGSAQLYGLADQLSNELKIDVSTGDPFARVDYPVELKSAIKKIGPSLAVAAGLAMKE
jgi:type IV pilus assembly protein PilM